MCLSMEKSFIIEPNKKKPLEQNNVHKLQAIENKDDPIIGAIAPISNDALNKAADSVDIIGQNTIYKSTDSSEKEVVVNPAKDQEPIQIKPLLPVAKKLKSQEKKDLEQLLIDGKKYFNESEMQNYDAALERFARFVINLQGTADDRKEEALNSAFECLIKLNVVKNDDIPSQNGKRYNYFRRMFAYYKEHRPEIDEGYVKEKLDRLGKLSLTKPHKVFNFEHLPNQALESYIDENSSYDYIKSLLVFHAYDPSNRAKIGIHNCKKSSEESLYAYGVSATAGIPETELGVDIAKLLEAEKMEDRHLIESFQIEQKGLDSIPAQLFAVMDGHSDKFHANGHKCSQFVKENLLNVLKQELDSKDSLSDLNIWNALKLSLVKVNDLWKDQGIASGSTVCFALIFNDPKTHADVIWTGNLGDSRILMGMGNKCIQLSTDARYRNESIDDNKLMDKKFLPSINLRNGEVIKDEQGIYRLAKVVQPLRCLGHHEEINGLSARPEIMKVDTSKFNEKLRLILFTDGIGDVIGSQQAIDEIQEYSVGKAANWLVEKAIQCRSKDNSTMIAVDIMNEKP